MDRQQKQELDELLDGHRDELFELPRRASREGWTIDQFEWALAERLGLMHRACMEWLKANQGSENSDRRSHDDQDS